MLTIVQQANASRTDNTGGNFSISPTSFSCAFSSPVSAGNILVLVWGETGGSEIGTGLGGAFTVNDTLSNSYTQLFQLQKGFSSGNGLGFWYVRTLVGGANTITLHYDIDTRVGPDTGQCFLTVLELSGISSLVGSDGQTFFSPGTLNVTDSNGTAVSIGGGSSLPFAGASSGVVDFFGGITDSFLLVSSGVASTLSPTISPSGYGSFSPVDSNTLSSNYLLVYLMASTPIEDWLIVNEPGSGLTDRSRYLFMGDAGQHTFTLQMRQRGNASYSLVVRAGDSYEPTIGSPIFLYDQNASGFTLMFSGLLQDFTNRWIGIDGDRYIDCTATSLESVFDTVYAGPMQFVNQTCGTIVASLYNAFETGCPVTLGTIQTGATIPLLVTNYEKLSDLFDQLATTSNFTWWVDPQTFELNFCAPTAIPAPFTLDSTEILWDTLNEKFDGADYRNRQAVRLSYDAFPHSMEFFVGAGQAQITLARPVQQVTNAWATLSTPNTATGSFSGNPSPGDTVTIGPAAGTWQALHIYGLGGVIVVNGYVQVVTTAGTSGGSMPTFPTITGNTVADGTVIWTCQGTLGLSTGNDTYTFVSSLDNTQFGQVLIGATDTATCQNLVDAINANAVKRTITISLPTWECSQCNAVNNVGTSFTLQQKAAGTGYVSDISTTSSAFSWSAPFTSGGTSPQGSLGPNEGATISLQVYVEGTSVAAPGVAYTPGSNVVSLATPLNVGSNLNIEYTRVDGDVIEVEDTSLVTALAAVTHGTGKYQQITDASSQGLISTSAAAGLQLAQEALAAYDTVPTEIELQLFQPGLLPGQELTVALSGVLGTAINGTYYIEEVRGELIPTWPYIDSVPVPGGGHYKYTLRLINVAQIASYMDFWEQRGGGGSAGGGSGAALVATSGGALSTSGTFGSPLTTKGDILGFDTAANRIPVGSDGDVLTADSTAPLGVSYKPVSGSGTVTSVGLSMPAEFSVSGSPVTTSGTLTVTKANESANQVYAGPTSGSPAAPSFRALVVADTPTSVQNGVLGIVIDGGGSTPSTGSKGFLQAPYSCTITGWTMLADQSGSASITVKKSTYAGFPTTSSIVGSAPPNLSSAQKNTSTTLTGWTTTITAGDVLEFNLTSVATVTRIILELQVTRT